MSDENVTNALLVEILREMQGTLGRLEKASARHDRKLDEHGPRFAALEARIGAVEARISGVDAGIHDAKDELESIIKLELGGQFGFFQTRVGHRLDDLTDRIAALEASGAPPA